MLFIVNYHMTSPPPHMTLYVSVVCVLISVIIWGAGIHDPGYQNIGYSFAFCITGGILMALGGVLAFVGGAFSEE